MSRDEVHTRVIGELNKLGVTSAMLLKCNDAQVATVVDMVDDAAFTGEDIKKYVDRCIVHNSKEGNTMTKDRPAPFGIDNDDWMKSQGPTYEEHCSTLKETTMTKSRVVGQKIGTVPGVAAEKLVRAGISVKYAWDNGGKEATVTAVKTTGKGLLGVLKAAKDVVVGAAEGAKDSYKSGKATRK